MALTMRLCFTNKEHADVLVAPGDTTIGSAQDNAVVVAAQGVAQHHVSLSVRERSFVLNVLDAQARTHVNARPVREKAILRLGDIVSLDTVQFMLKPDRDDSIRTKIPAPKPGAAEPDGATRTRLTPPRVVLRGVSGAYFGKIIPIRGKLVIGRGSECDLILDEPEMSRRHAVIENFGDGIYLRDLGSANGTFVNGVQVRDAVLHPDDQIAFDRNRFLLEAPGMPARGEVEPASEQDTPNITQTMQAIRAPEPQKPAPANERSRNDVWWLIGAAVVSAIGIALLLYARF